MNIFCRNTHSNNNNAIFGYFAKCSFSEKRTRLIIIGGMREEGV